MFNRCLFRHITKDEKIVTHIQTKEGLRRGGSTYLDGIVLDFVRVTVEKDLYDLKWRDRGKMGGLIRDNGRCTA
ncbi:hypothetical protein PVK06_005618 [Gossypium arboreum]|uniref:Uncharacterized protein n=1 Tax=Gossypium arboreum TaxID=29729 RepID=A0ABR0QV21_GOSAR|nr:hypothetical protein PVK06_005618 [Gossypium arboreum]